MATLRIRDVYGNTFEIDASARPFWERREGYEILDDSGETPQEPAESSDPKPSKKAASRPASEDKE